MLRTILDRSVGLPIDLDLEINVEDGQDNAMLELLDRYAGRLRRLTLRGMVSRASHPLKKFPGVVAPSLIIVSTRNWDLQLQLEFTPRLQAADVWAISASNVSEPLHGLRDLSYGARTEPENEAEVVSRLFEVCPNLEKLHISRAAGLHFQIPKTNYLELWRGRRVWRPC